MQTGNIPRDKAVAARAYDNASSWNTGFYYIQRNDCSSDEWDPSILTGLALVWIEQDRHCYRLLDKRHLTFLTLMHYIHTFIPF
jgi:hypothetical protein